MVDVARSLRDAAPHSVWLTPTVQPSCPDLEVGTEVDLLVVGSGFTGLWAAIEAARSGRSVVVVDSRTIAGGASGKCGGFINASITHGIPNGHARWPNEMTTIVRLQQSLWNDTLDLLAERGEGEIIEATGKLTVATTDAHLARLGSSVEVFRRYGQDIVGLDAGQLVEHASSPTFLGGYLLRTANGICDPVRLAKALTEIARDAGVRFYEGTEIVGLTDRGAAVAARTAAGVTVVARQVLLATNAYPPLIKRLRALVIPVYDHVIATEPLSLALWDEIGWNNRVGITDAGNQFHYYRPTSDGRILFGGWDATYHRGGRVDDRLESNRQTHELLVRHLVATFPALENVRITNVWGGPIDSTTRFTPTFHTVRRRKVGWAVGFTGLGIGASRFAALAALDLLGDVTTERTALSMVRRQPLPFPPEPLRWPLIAMTKRALIAEDVTGRRGGWLRLLDRFGVGFDT